MAAVAAVLAATFTAAQHQTPFEQHASSDSPKASSADLLKQGTAAMSTGRFADAVAHFSDAISLDPDNYLSYYRRATAALSLGRSSSALSDFDKIIELNPKFAQAHVQRAKLLAKEGKLEGAKDSVDRYLKLKVDDEEAKELRKAIAETTSNLNKLRKAKEGVDKAIQSGKNVTSDKTLISKVEDCMRLASLVLEVSPSLLEVRRDRADCALAKGDHEDAIADWT